MPTCLACLCSRNCVPFVLTCSRANVSCVLACSNANVSCILTCSRANVTCVLSCSCANAFCVHTCSHAITSNNKNKAMFYLDFQYFFFVFYLWNEIVYEKYTTDRNVSRNIYFENLSLSGTLRIIFKSLINSERWIITNRS